MMLVGKNLLVVIIIQCMKIFKYKEKYVILKKKKHLDYGEKTVAMKREGGDKSAIE